MPLLALGACQDEPPFNFAVQDVRPSPSSLPEDLRSITVTLAHPYEKTGPLPPRSDIVVEPMKEALTDAIDHAAIFQDDTPVHVNLAATVLKLRLPSPGFTMKTGMDCRYVLIDRSTVAELFSTIVASAGDVSMDFSWSGRIRVKESVNRAVQNNIATFLQQVEASPLARPRDAFARPASAQPGRPLETAS